MRAAKTLVDIVNVKFRFELFGGRKEYYINLVTHTEADHMLSKVKF